MFICPACRTPYDTPEAELCPRDRRRLVKAEDFWSADGDPMLGRQIAGRFTILSRIGLGGMGTVYRAEQASIGRNVAIKILKDTLHKEPDTVTRFHREAKATSLLQHPNTVTIFDFGQTKDGLLYIAMELLEGELLTSVLERESVVAVERAIQIAKQILGSLHEAHDRGIIHRDLKPDNIYLTRLNDRSDHVKVLDFGIAKVFHTEHKMDALETQAGVVFGTPRYMSPEQAQSRPLDGRSDLYAVGTLLYQMIAGRPPFEDTDAVVVMARHIKTRPAPPSALRPDLSIPESLEGVIMQALEKDPGLRPQTAHEFAMALTACEAGGSVRRSPALRASRRARARNMLALATLTALLGGGLALAALWKPPDRASKDTHPGRAKIASSSPKQQAFWRISIESMPPGANVRRNGVVLGPAPIESMEERSGPAVEFELSLDSHETVKRVVVPRGDSTLSIHMTPRPPARMARPRTESGQSGPSKSPYERFY